MTISKEKRERKKGDGCEEENLKGRGDTSSAINCITKHGNVKVEGGKREKEIVSNSTALNLHKL